MKALQVSPQAVQCLFILLFLKFGDSASDFRMKSVSVRNYHPEIAWGKMEITQKGRYVDGFINITQPMNKIFVSDFLTVFKKTVSNKKKSCSRSNQKFIFGEMASST